MSINHYLLFLSGLVPLNFSTNNFRTLNLLHKVSELREKLGIPLPENEAANEPEDNFTSRKLKSFEEDPNDLPECPQRSPQLLGPLYVRQQSLPKLKPGTSAFKKHYR